MASWNIDLSLSSVILLTVTPFSPPDISQTMSPDSRAVLSLGFSGSTEAKHAALHILIAAGATGRASSWYAM